MQGLFRLPVETRVVADAIFPVDGIQLFLFSLTRAVVGGLSQVFQFAFGQIGQSFLAAGTQHFGHDPVGERGYLLVKAFGVDKGFKREFLQFTLDRFLRRADHAVRLIDQ